LGEDDDNDDDDSQKDAFNCPFRPRHWISSRVVVFFSEY
jgi:hypothetical protein